VISLSPSFFEDLFSRPKLKVVQLLYSPPKLRLNTKFGLQKGGQKLFRQFDAYNLSPNAQQVYIIMLYTLVRRVDIVADSRSNPRRFVPSNGGAYPCATHQNTTLGVTITELVCYPASNIRKIYRFRAKGTIVGYLVPPTL
jgi:hypothetical protein